MLFVWAVDRHISTCPWFCHMASAITMHAHAQTVCTRCSFSSHSFVPGNKAKFNLCWVQTSLNPVLILSNCFKNKILVKIFLLLYKICQTGTRNINEQGMIWMRHKLGRKTLKAMHSKFKANSMCLKTVRVHKYQWRIYNFLTCILQINKGNFMLY